MESENLLSTTASANQGQQPECHERGRGCLRFFIKTILALAILIVAILTAVKVWWDFTFFDGYDGRLPLQAEVVERGEQSGHYREKVKFQGMEGERVTALFHFPKGSTGELPCLVLLYGIGQEMDFVDEIADPYVQAGYGIFCIEQYGQGDRKLKKKSGLKALLHLTRRLPRMVNETRRAVDYLETRPEIDAERLTFFGISLGAIMGTSALAMEPRFANGILMWGGGNIPQLLTQNKFARSGLQRYQRSALRLLGSGLFSAAEPLKRIQCISPRPLLFQNALRDELIPRECTEAYFEKAGNPKEILWYDCGHDGDDAGLTMELIHKIIADQISWLKKTGKVNG